MKLIDVAKIADGSLSGSYDVEITGVAGISEAKEGDITFLAGPRWLKELRNTRASAVLVKEFAGDLEKPQVKTANPQYAFARLLSHFYVTPYPCKGVSERAFVAQGASIGADVTVYDFAYIAEGVTIGPGSVIYPGVFVGEGSSLGDRCVIYPNVTIRERVTIGSRVIVHANAVIGSDGFGYVFEGGRHNKIPQVGGVVIGDDVEIGAGVTIDRATTGNTVIGSGTKIDNLVQIGHNVQIGSNAILVAQVGIAGSSRIGDGVILGGQVGIADHAVIEAGTMLGAQSGIMGEVKRGVYSGSPAIPHREWLRSVSLFAKLPELKKKIDELEAKVKKMEGR
jgi:UDP-3-O-[3-hydroxymyristoyl] glucosamine N-acyltransferase